MSMCLFPGTVRGSTRVDGRKDMQDDGDDDLMVCVPKNLWIFLLGSALDL